MRLEGFLFLDRNAPKLAKDVVASELRLPEFDTQLHIFWLHEPKQVFSVFSFIKQNSLS